MKYLFVIAMKKEAKEIIKHYDLKKIDNNYYLRDNISLVITDITRNGVTSSLINLLYEKKLNYKEYTMINIGMVGSNNLKINSVYLVDKSYGYNFDLTPFDEPLYNAPYSPYQMDLVDNINKVNCYTSDGFVLNTNIKDDAIFDMELNSIITFPFVKKYSIKVISDSLSNDEYNNFNFDKSLPKIYEILDDIITE